MWCETGIFFNPCSAIASNIERASVSEKACPACTFINHIDVVFCEACESRFPENATPNILQQINTTTSQTSLAALNEDLTVKISFRAGGIIEFVKVLKGALAAKEWEKTSSAQGTSLEDATKALSVGVTGGGISGIIKKVDHTNQVLDQTLSSSFQDLDALMSKASEMVKLAESINSRLATASSTGGAASSSSLDAPELVAFRSFLVDLGIPSPVTKEMTGDAYTQELAKELSDFLHRVLPRYSGILPLTDLYCLFNRARGVALISPQDLQKSVGLFETLGLPFRVRKFDSGLTVVHSSAFGDDAIATRVVAIVQEQAGMGGWGGGGITALDVAAREGVSIVLAKELLLITEKYGLVCRDDSVEGLRFYDNVMLKC
ncbi:Vps36-domain-containing protein [Rhizoclosmatium globosum]|uniref:Vacuolar protein-sorting-associated protein 36 n=1 Tax=Rhizoclosmatium globosum TaxID=329046 RepID=A0A1Y2CSL8_9FUNG|nr:Vps36-domain-containing protein [Rhizoclosmatium globosum]|eukprot:ORY50038.1 Vps36-domain-containing protein [Rhizoclosmatium globosum]